MIKFLMERIRAFLDFFFWTKLHHYSQETLQNCEKMVEQKNKALPIKDTVTSSSRCRSEKILNLIWPECRLWVLVRKLWLNEHLGFYFSFFSSASSVVSCFSCCRWPLWGSTPPCLAFGSDIRKRLKVGASAPPGEHLLRNWAVVWVGVGGRGFGTTDHCSGHLTA